MRTQCSSTHLHALRDESLNPFSRSHTEVRVTDKWGTGLDNDRSRIVITIHSGVATERFKFSGLGSCSTLSVSPTLAENGDSGEEDTA